ncbi:MAG: efflux RND transporter permease subunit [Granulosicoccus sp.]
MHALIAWFTKNSVAANLLMVFIIAWGLSALASRIPLEVFPAFELDNVTVTVPFVGASPAEVEEGVTIKIEEAIQDVRGIKRMTSTARESVGSVFIEVTTGFDTRKVLEDIKQRVDRIDTFSDEVGTPSVVIPDSTRDVISVVVSGALPEKELRLVASRVRDDLEALPDVSAVSVSGVREYELSIEIPQRSLQRYQLTLSAVAQAIEASSLDLAAGAIQTAGGEVLLRTRGQAYDAEDFNKVVVLARPDGTRVTLGEIATITDGFEQIDLVQRYNGQRSIEIDVQRTGLQSAITVSDAVKKYLVEAQPGMPYGVTLGYWRDWSRIVRARLNTLTNSAIQGGFLIMILLTLFLRFWVAAWVFIGVPVSILGGIALMPLFGVSLNLLSLFAFILVLGIVVDDAIVTGENIYTHMRRNPNRIQAAIEGAQEVSMPVTFGVLTTVAAFTPLLMIEGIRGKIFAQIPLIIIPVLLFSIIESKFVLPSHMSHLNFFKNTRPNLFARLQHRIADGFEWFVDNAYQPVLAAALRNRYLVLALFAGSAVIIFSLVSSGHIRFIFMPRVQSEVARASLEMPDGTPFEVTERHIERMTEAARTLQKKYVDPDTNESVIEGIMATIGSSGHGQKASHRGRVLFEITPPEERTLQVSSRELVADWRREIGDIPGAKNISYRAEIGGGSSPVDVEISGFDFAELQEVAGLIKEKLRGYSGVTDISDTFEGGKQEIQLGIKPEGIQLGLTLSDIARQVRIAYLGTEVQSIQRNRDEVKVILRYPQAERESIDALERLIIRTASGQNIPLASVANIENGRGYSVIRRIDRRRTLNVEADVDKTTADIEGIKNGLANYAQELETNYPNIRLTLEGEAREQRESFASLRQGLLFVLLAIYALLAIPFRSYIQPLMVMIVIPFGVVGGVLGHMIMGMSLSIMSYMGMLALCGVVVNDSLVLVDWVNRQRAAGMPLFDAVRSSGVARFRAVILTSLTTFFGLLPLIYETSTQAQFLIPMAVSLGYGILFATVVTLILIPVNYLVLEDIRRLFGGGVKNKSALSPTETRTDQLVP